MTDSPRNLIDLVTVQALDYIIGGSTVDRITNYIKLPLLITMKHHKLGAVTYLNCIPFYGRKSVRALLITNKNVYL